MKFKIRIFACAFSLVVLLSPVISVAQNEDVDAYRRITRIEDASVKIDALNKFRSDFPTSRYVQYSLNLSFTLFTQLGNVDSALSYAEKYAAAVPENSRDGAYNNIASELSNKKMALDKANIYTNLAVTSARTNKSRSLHTYLNTQAEVYFNLGKTDSALIIQKEVVAGNEKNAEYLLNLAIYEEASGNMTAALKTISKSILLERADKALNYFNSWLEKESSDISARENLKNSLCREAFTEYLKNDSSVNAKSNIAAYLAVLKADFNTAEKLTNEVVANISDKTSIEDLVVLRTNAAIVYNVLGNPNKALEELKKAKLFATVWDNNYWMLLGNIYEALYQDEFALDAYLSTKIAGGDEKIDQAVSAVAKKLGLGEDAVAKKLESLKEEMTEFEPDSYDKNSFGQKVVVAELFTGAECPPCVAADRAYDKLSELYPRDAVVILEYHVHIPGPDPITNPDTYLKWVFYGGDFGTPTVFFNGGDKLVGGGPDYVTKNMFNVYQYLIEKSAKQPPQANISGNASLNNNEVNIAVTIEPSAANYDLQNCIVQIALLEKSINYKGSNGIAKHAFAVRDLVNGAEGIPVSLTNGKQSINQKMDVGVIETSIKTYLDDPSKDPSWRMRSGFAGWKVRPDNIDRKNLAVVVYVQNKTTKEILQARFFDLN